MSEEKKVANEEVNPLDNFVVAFNYTLKDVNNIITMMNHPFSTPILAWANLINDIHLQIDPQVKAFNQKGDDESKTTSKKSGD